MSDTRITRSQFLDTFSSGIDLESKRLRSQARRAGVPMRELRALDADGDRVLDTQGELGGAWELLDELDALDEGVDLAGHSEDGFTDVGRDNAVYHGMADAIVDPGERRVAVARSMLSDPRLARGFEGQATGGEDNRMLSHNRMHRGRRREDGLIATPFVEAYRCNLFVGDVLHRSGIAVPKVHAQDGSWTHYAYAERWPRSPHFDRVSRLEDVRPGDIMVVDYPGRGSGGGHIELVTGVEPREDGRAGLVSIGARWGEDAIVEDGSRAEVLNGAQRVDDHRDGAHFATEDGTRVFLLRPRAERAYAHLHAHRL